MTQAFQRNNQRHCSRCHRELEDPASEERGVGPICALKDTVLYARTIQANYAAATAVLLGMSDLQFPEACQVTFLHMRETVLRKGAVAAQQNTDLSVIHLDGQDLRGVIKEIDWLLSHRVEDQVRKFLIKVVRFLGYVELAAVLSQEASTTNAPLWFNNTDGRVYLQGKACKAGFMAMRQIPDVIVPKFRGAETPYSVPASQVTRFLEIVQDFWPLYSVTNPDASPIPGATLATINQQAQEWLSVNQPVVAPTPVPKTPVGPVAAFQMRSLADGDWLEVAFPWIFEKTTEMYVLVAKLKTVPKRERKYDGVSKSWLFKPQHRELVEQAVSRLFPLVKAS